GREPEDGPDAFADIAARDVVAEIWATVDLDRALRELGAPGERLADDPLLGAAIRLVRREGGPTIALAEPITEGRLAASLARFGEGSAGRYVVARDGLVGAARELARRGVRLSRPAEGPFGLSVLVLGGPVAGPHLVLVDPAAGTIDR
ncbi:MAG TPA: hypothetical protein VFO73_09235, partial [Candidatus Limnocylindrales bacterium]|nr:hypothetical protein [Candidatus Limnocylindrales bacterium]